MTSVSLLADATDINNLAEKLKRYSCVNRFDEKGEPQAGVLAHAFADLEESFKRYLEVHLPRLTGGNLSEDQVQEILQDIGEGLRHIQWHIRDTRYYKYLLQDD